MIWVNKIGPFNNPQETYTYNSLPFCKASDMEEPEAHALGIGEILEGNELFNSGQRAKFAIDTEKTALCSQTLSDADALKFGAAVSVCAAAFGLSLSECRRTCVFAIVTRWRSVRYAGG